MNILAKTTLLISASVIVLVSCHGTKKGNTTQTASSNPPATTPTPPPAAPTTTVAAAPLLLRNGIVPTDLELQAIKQKYPETTAQNLANGHELYIGTCTDCHRKKNIFAYSESRWKEIVDDMAPRSKLNAQQTDDLYKYVLSMKATQNLYAR
jgi:mono/diheme cytochrome c family protein